MHTELTQKTLRILLAISCMLLGLFFFASPAHAGLFSDNIANDLNTLDQSGDQETGTTVFDSGNFSVNYCSSGDCNTSFYSNGDGTYSTIVTDNNTGGYSQGSYNTNRIPIVTLYVTNITAATAETNMTARSVSRTRSSCAGFLRISPRDVLLLQVQQMQTFQRAVS
jgi:hypothetical protein